jgi:hypothetical protein
VVRDVVTAAVVSTVGVVRVVRVVVLHRQRSARSLQLRR